MRGDATCTLDVDFGPDSRLGRAALLRRAARVLRPLAAGGRRRRARRRGAGPDLRDGRRLAAARPRSASSTTAAAGATSRSGRSPARGRRSTTCTATARCRSSRPREDEPRRFTYDPAHPVPTIGGNYCSVGELPADGAGMEPAWSRFLSPVLRLRNILTPGPMDQKETPEFFAAREPYPRSRSAPTCSSTRRSRSRSRRGDGPSAGEPAGLLERRRHRLHREARSTSTRRTRTIPTATTC